MHITFFCLIIETVEKLSHIHHAERTGRKDLSLSTCEHSTSVCARQNADFGSQRTDLIDPASIDTLAVIQQPAANDIFLKFVQALVDDTGVLRILLIKRCMNLIIDRKKSCVTNQFVIGIHGNADFLHCHILDSLKQIVRYFLTLKRHLRLADLSDDGVDELHDLTVHLVASNDSIEHSLVVDFICACLDHNDLLRRTDNRKLQVVVLALFMGGIDNDLAVYQSDGNACDRSIPRNVGDRDCDRRSNQSSDIRCTVGIDRHDSHDDSHVVAHILREQGAEGTVNKAGSQNGLLTCAAFSAQETSWNLSYCIKFLFIINRKREIIDALSRFSAHCSSAEHYSLAVTDEA